MTFTRIARPWHPRRAGRTIPSVPKVGRCVACPARRRARHSSAPTSRVTRTPVCQSLPMRVSVDHTTCQVAAASRRLLSAVLLPSGSFVMPYPAWRRCHVRTGHASFIGARATLPSRRPMMDALRIPMESARALFLRRVLIISLTMSVCLRTWSIPRIQR